MTVTKLAQRLLLRDPPPPLRPTKIWKAEFQKKIEEIVEKPLVAAGLHLLNDDLNSAHLLAQDNEGETGDYWHAIVHRREGDFMNSKYWYRRVGQHKVFAKMRSLYPEWEPIEFVNRCAKGSQPELVEMQLREIRFVLATVLRLPALKAARPPGTKRSKSTG